MFWGCNNQPSTSLDVGRTLTATNLNTEKRDSIHPYLWIEGGNKYDFGIVSEKNKTIPIEIKIKNTGSNPLLILKTDVSCGCISVKYPQQPIMVAEKEKINIVINTKGQKGYFNKVIYINSNAFNNVELFRIVGQIK